MAEAVKIIAIVADSIPLPVGWGGASPSGGHTNAKAGSQES
jgi:hypothetical protein